MAKISCSFEIVSATIRLLTQDGYGARFDGIDHIEVADEDEAAVVALLSANGGEIASTALQMKRDAALKRVDAEAETERLKYITAGNGQMLTYSQKAEEARAFADDASPDPADYPLLSAEVGITGATIADVAAVVSASFEQWQAIGCAIEQTRLGAKKAVAEAADAAGVQAVLDGLNWPEPAA